MVLFVQFLNNYDYAEKHLTHILYIGVSVLVVDRVLGPVLVQGSTATGSQKGWPGKMGRTTGTINAKNGLHMQSMYEYTSSTSVC